MKYYVLGFAFSEELHRVVLIKKNRPEWQAGLFNGVGGKVEPDEAFSNAMSREFEKEAGLKVEPINWIEFGYMEGEDFHIRAFCTVLSDLEIAQVKTCTDELISVLSVTEVMEISFHVISNLRTIFIPHAKRHILKTATKTKESND